MAEKDLRNERRTLKRRIKRLEKELLAIRADPVAYGHKLAARHSLEEQRAMRAIAFGNYTKPLLKFLAKPGPGRGRPSTLDNKRRRLSRDMRKLSYEAARGKSAVKIAWLLEPNPKDNNDYLRQEVGDLINWVMENFTRRMPGESRKSQRDRALDLILLTKVEE